MSEWLDVMRKAEEALCLLQLWDVSEGQRRLEKLVAQHPDDGMVYFKRAQGFESVGIPEAALKDYLRAKLPRRC